MTQADKNNQEIILEYFGLGQNARGKGLGKSLLQWTINQVWKYQPKKIQATTHRPGPSQRFTQLFESRI